MKRRRIYGILTALLLAAGTGVFFYPMISDWINTYHYEGEANRYVEESRQMQPEEYDAQLEAAEEYNHWLTQFSSIEEAVSASMDDGDHTYARILSMDQDGVMGIIYIPDIHVYLPVYHGTEEEALQKGAGHYQGSSLPVGGESTHAVITGHTGLTSAKMFSEIDTMSKGDVFYLYVLGATLKYQVDQTEVVEPKEIKELSIEQGKDYVTLVTCTPYGINSHRLLVRGSRIPNADNLHLEERADSHEKVKLLLAAAALFSVFLLGFLLGSLWGKRRCHRVKKFKRKEQEKL